MCVCVSVCVCVCVCVCLCVCLSGHAILAVPRIKSIMKDTIVFSVRFANCLRKLERFLLTLAGAAIFS